MSSEKSTHTMKNPNSFFKGYPVAESDLELRKLQLQAEELGLTGYEKLSKNGLKMFIDDVIDSGGSANDLQKIFFIRLSIKGCRARK